MSVALCLALFSPLLSFIFQLTTSSFLTRKQSAIISCSSIALSFVLFIGILTGYLQSQMAPMTVTLFEWIPVDKIHANFSLHIDSLALLMALIITGIGFLIHVYSVGYMEHEQDYVRYFACLNLFIFAMLLLVLADNLALLFVGWEGVGLTSYLLIGYDYYRPKAVSAAKKAFVVNRIGDVGFLMGLLFTFYIFGTSEISNISNQLSDYSMGDPLLTTTALLLFIGACGKSAQLPLHVWLADAMEGPTPVSALIHAATMVTAGVYLVVRMHVLFSMTPLVLLIIGSVGAATALFAALAASGQTDLKRVLAYSTVSQLGFMFLACGVNAHYAAMFHLTTHAFMKALLFLCAGNVLHMMHGETDMRKMGGLSKTLKITNRLFLIGVLAMSGIPPFAAFFSKDLILEQVHLAGFNVLFVIGLIASTLTAFYLTRAYCLTFLGSPRKESTVEAPAPTKDAPLIMLIPVTILAVLSVIGGFLGFGFNQTPVLIDYLAEIGIKPSEIELSSHFNINPGMLAAVSGAFLAIGIAALLYTRYYESLGQTLKTLTKAFYINEIYALLFAWPLKVLSGTISNFIEPVIFSGSIHKITQSTQAVAQFLQQMQSGQTRSYAAWMAIGAAFLVVYMLSFIG